MSSDNNQQQLPLWLVGHSQAVVKRRKFVLPIIGRGIIDTNNNSKDQGEDEPIENNIDDNELFTNNNYMDSIDVKTYKAIENHIRETQPNLCVNPEEFIHSSQIICSAQKKWKEKQSHLEKIESKKKKMISNIKRTYEEKYISNTEKLEKVIRNQQQRQKQDVADADSEGGDEDGDDEDNNNKDHVDKKLRIELKQLQKEKKRKKRELLLKEIENEHQEAESQQQSKRIKTVANNSDDNLAPKTNDEMKKQEQQHDEKNTANNDSKSNNDNDEAATTTTTTETKKAVTTSTVTTAENQPPEVVNNNNNDNDDSNNNEASKLTNKKQNELKQLTDKMKNLKETKKQIVWLLRQVITAEKKRKDVIQSKDNTSKKEET